MKIYKRPIKPEDVDKARAKMPYFTIESAPSIIDVAAPIMFWLIIPFPDLGYYLMVEDRTDNTQHGDSI